MTEQTTGIELVCSSMEEGKPTQSSNITVNDPNEPSDDSTRRSWIVLLPISAGTLFAVVSLILLFANARHVFAGDWRTRARLDQADNSLLGTALILMAITHTSGQTQAVLATMHWGWRNYLAIAFYLCNAALVFLLFPDLPMGFAKLLLFALPPMVWLFQRRFWILFAVLYSIAYAGLLVYQFRFYTVHNYTARRTAEICSMILFALVVTADAICTLCLLRKRPVATLPAAAGPQEMESN